MGLVTIRSHGSEQLLVEEFDKYQDRQSSAWFLLLIITKAFSYWMDIVCILFLASVMLIFVVLSNYLTVTGSQVGLVITQTLSLIGLFHWGMRQSVELENHMTAVENILDYGKLEKERDSNPVSPIKAKRRINTLQECLF